MNELGAIKHLKLFVHPAIGFAACSYFRSSCDSPILTCKSKPCQRYLEIPNTKN